MAPRPETRTLAVSLLAVVVGAVELGSPGASIVGRALGVVLALGAARVWRLYWADRDRYNEWRRRYRR